jgi:hypothetical protein
MPSPLSSKSRKRFGMLALCAAAALAGCTSAQDILEPSALAADTSNPLPQALFPTATGATPPQVAAIKSSARIRFAPVVGAASEASTPLAARIAERAAARGITLTGAEDGSATHILKGYFSAISERAGTTVIYVWDVLDATGTRIHRIQGQAKSPAGAGQGWAGVQQPTMEAIADQTVDQLAAWLTSDQG